MNQINSLKVRSKIRVKLTTTTKKQTNINLSHHYGDRCFK